MAPSGKSEGVKNQRYRFHRRGAAAQSITAPRKAGLSGDMALRIEKAFGVKTDTLLRMQASYDIAQTRKRENHIHVRLVSLRNRSRTR